jgi:predicted metal-dependent peptidase
MPSLRSETCGPLAFTFDVSGSVDEAAFEQMTAEAQAAVDAVKPSLVYFIYCDAKVQRIDTFGPDEPLTFKSTGGGGTDFRPAFEALEDLDEQPVAMVYLTDLEGSFPSTDPGIPTLWAVVGDETQVPFGEVITLDT